MHKLVKFTKGHEYGEEVTGWHLVAEVADGEFTACGLSHVDYSGVERKEKDKGGITCVLCLDAVRFYKSVKL